MYKPIQITAFKRMIACILILGQLLASCNNSGCPFKPEQKKWDPKKNEYTCPGGHHPRQESETIRLAREQVNREQAAASSSRYQQRMQHEMEEKASRQPDFFQRSQENYRKVEEDFEALHQDQARRKQAEIEQMEQRNRAWKEQIAREKEQKLREDKERAAREEIKLKEREINRLHEQAWIRAGEEELEREKAAKKQEQARQEEERKRALEKSHREAEASWNKVWEARERAYEEQRKKKEKEQQLYEKYLPLVEERLKEKARQAEAERLRLEKEEAEEKRRSEEERRKQQEAFREEIHRSVEEHEKEAEWTRKQLQAEMKLAQEATEALFKVEIPIHPVQSPNPVDSMLIPTSADVLIRRNFLEKLRIADFDLDEDFKRQEEEEEERYMANLKRQLGFNTHKTKKEVAKKNNKPTEVEAMDLSAGGLQDKADLALDAEPSKDHARLNTEDPKSVSTQNKSGEETEQKSLRKLGVEINKDTEQKSAVQEDFPRVDPKEAEKEVEKKDEEACKKEVIRRKQEEKYNKVEERVEQLEQKYPASIAFKTIMNEVEAYMQALEASTLSPLAQKQKGQELLKQIAALKSGEEASINRLEAVYLTENSPEGDRLVKEELAAKESQLEKIKELRGNLLAVLDLTIEELRACGIERDNSSGLVLGISTIPLVDIKDLPTEEQLAEEMTSYLGIYEKHAAFQQLLEAYNRAVTKFEAAPNNLALQANKAGIEAKLQNHKLYKKGVWLMMTATYIRQAAENEAKQVLYSSIKGSGIGGHIVSTEELARASQLRADADRIKHNIIIPFRNIFQCPNSPSGGRRVVSGIKGAARSLEDTGKGILVISSLPVLLAKFGYDGVESLVKWEDKLGVKDKYIAAKNVIKVLFEDTKYDWEHPEEYRKRQQAIQAYKQHMLAYNRAFNAEGYHCEQEEEFGYATMEALQFVFGEEVIKVVGRASKSAKVEKGAVELSKIGAQVTKDIKVEKEIADSGAKLATNSVRLQKQLASEMQMTSQGDVIIKFPKLQNSKNLVEKYGGELKDWVKKTSKSFNAKDGLEFETHWYENIRTGQRVEFKTKLK